MEGKTYGRLFRSAGGFAGDVAYSVGVIARLARVLIVAVLFAFGGEVFAQSYDCSGAQFQCEKDVAGQPTPGLWPGGSCQAGGSSVQVIYHGSVVLTIQCSVVTNPCTTAPSSSACLTYCASNPTAAGCESQPYCSTHPTDLACSDPNICHNNPTSSSCVQICATDPSKCTPPPDFCTANPTDLACSDPSICHNNPTSPSCQQICSTDPTKCTPPVDPCVADPTGPTCSQDPPDYCTEHPDTEGCVTAPGYCNTHPNAAGCPNAPGYCNVNPMASGCPTAPDYCNVHPEASGCESAPNYCNAHPDSPGCASAPGYCNVNPGAPGCPTAAGYCNLNPSAPGCPGSAPYCVTHPDDPACKNDANSPPWCHDHPDDAACKNDANTPGFCSQPANDANPSCPQNQPGSTEYCARHPGDLACMPAANFCHANPNDPSCRAQFCAANPTDPSCAHDGSGCNPDTDSGCSGNDFCKDNPDVVACAKPEASGGANCTEQPNCEGEEVLCLVALEAWRSACATEKAFPMTGDVPTGLEGQRPEDLQVIEDHGDDMLSRLDSGGFLGGGSCPQLPSFSAMGASFSFADAPWFCSFVSALGGIIFFVGTAIAVGILAKG